MPARCRHRLVFVLVFVSHLSVAGVRDIRMYLRTHNHTRANIYTHPHTLTHMRTHDDTETHPCP